MIIRSAKESDITAILHLRNKLEENQLVNPTLITAELCRSYAMERGKGWVCYRHDELAGFGIVDFQDRHIWALMVQPQYEDFACSGKLHDILLDWYFASADGPLWLGTNQVAEDFFTGKGWHKAGITEDGEVRFEITKQKWQERHIREEAE